MDILFTSDDALRSGQGPSSLFEPLPNPRRSADEAMARSPQQRREMHQQQQLPQPHIDIHLIIFDPASDSSLTPGWTVPVDALSLPASISITGLFQLLRDHLPKPIPTTPSTTKTTVAATGPTSLSASRRTAVDSSGSGRGERSSTMLWPSLQKKDVDSSANDNNNTSYDDRGSVDVERPLTPSSPHCSSASAANAVVAAGETVCSVEAPRRRPHLKFLLPLAIPVPLRRPKLDFVRVYLIASGGEVVPLCRDDADWHFKRGLAKCDLSGRSDADWRQLKDLLLATAGTLKCYIAIKAVDII